MASSFFMPSFDIVSFFIPSSLPILSWAKAAGASARLSETAATETPSAKRVRMVMVGDPFERFQKSDGCRSVQDGRATGFVTRRFKIFPQRAFEASVG